MEQGEYNANLDPSDWEDADAIFSALAARCRRILLVELAAESGAESIVGLAHRLAVFDAGPTGCPDAYLELYHTHGPVLEQAGLVEWDRTSGEMRLTATGEELAATLDTSTDT
jgi:hypothetical protein